MKSKIYITALFFTQFIFAQFFHDTQGKVEVSSSGQASFSLPVALPPSIHDVGPTVNLVYSSGQMGGIAGQGWNISSISAISRIATRLDIDGFIDGVDFDDNDKLALDGQRLLLKTGTYWAENSTYETEVQSNTKIELKGSGSAIYFIVTSPDGSKTFYGSYLNSNAYDVTSFYINRFEDVKGNFMTYDYFKPFNSSLCIKQINFSANTFSNAVPQNKIVFNYELAARKENAYIQGIKIEKVELLKSIVVYTTDLKFKEYKFTHEQDAQLGYQRVSKIQEFNGAGEPANPIEFNYATTVSTSVGSEIVTNYTNNINFSAIEISGDFDGDGFLDFVTDNGILHYKNFSGFGTSTAVPFVVNNTRTFSVTTLNNNKLNQKNSILKILDLGGGRLKFNVYDLKNNELSLNYFKNVTTAPHQYTYDEEYSEQYLPTEDVYYVCGGGNNCYDLPDGGEDSEKTFIEGDFNGDGISEIIMESADSMSFTKYIGNITAMNGSCSYCNQSTNSRISSYQIIDLNPNVTATTSTLSLGAASEYFEMSRQTYMRKYVADFNGDGKSDILCLKLGGYKILTVNKDNTFEIIGSGLIPEYSPAKQLLLGDFNGDGKTDIMMPQGNGSNEQKDNSNWHIFYSNPKLNFGSFFDRQVYSITPYWPDSNSYYSTGVQSSNFYAIDTNKDGKTDLVKIWRNYYKPQWTINDHDTNWQITTFANNTGFGSNTFNLDYITPCQPMQFNQNCAHWSDSPEMVTPIVATFKYNSLNNEIVLIRKHTNELTYINFTKDVSQDNTLTKVTQAAGNIVDEFVYKTMQPETATTNNTGATTDYYSSENTLNYPYVEFKQLLTNKIVTQHSNTAMGIKRLQDFKYCGLSVHLGGLGMLGFRKNARTNWYRGSGDKKTWSVSENDALKRNATTLSYSLLLASGQAFMFGMQNATGILSKIENDFTQNTNPITKRYTIVLNKQKSIDYLTNVTTEKIYSDYSSDYFLPRTVISKNFLNATLYGTTTTVTDFDNSVSGTGTNYYIGRTRQVETKIDAYGDSKSSKTNYSYAGANITKIEKTANNSGEVHVEEMDYFANGFLKKKTVSAVVVNPTMAVSPRTASFTYDPSNRFVKTTTDAEGLVTTNNTYHALYGLVLSQTNPYNLTTTTVYDNWGKQTKVTDFLGKSANFAYAFTSGVYTTTQSADDGSSSISENDALGRPIRKGAKDINGLWNYANTEYDYVGRKFRESEPYAASASPSQWTTTFYDDYNRPIRVEAFTGKIVYNAYDGLSGTTYQAGLVKSTTKDANGNVISATDLPGGTITFQYTANGLQTLSDYDGIKIETHYDDWGRKISLSDPSAGNYSYSYNAFGETLTETTPKGISTYKYDAFGKMITKNIIGYTTAERTDCTTTFVYDGETKLLISNQVTNPYDGDSEYQYRYDERRRIIGTTEKLPYASFTKNITYDAFGRVETEHTKAAAHGQSTENRVRNSYKNGAPWQIIDVPSNKVLWQTNTTNSRGQLTSATLGNGMAVTNTYDAFGYATQFKHSVANTNVFNLTMQFEPIRSNLTNRYSNLFDLNESFDYDLLDRLTTSRIENALLYTATFNTSTEGFTYIGGYGGTAILENQKLKVRAPQLFCGTKKLIVPNAALGQTIRVEAEVLKISGSSTISAQIVEINPVNGALLNSTEIASVGSGIFSAEYTPTFNSNLFLHFILDGSAVGFRQESSMLLPGPIPTTTFTVDNVKVTKMLAEVQDYDDRGRITTNSTVGDYHYDDQQHPYQATEVSNILGATNEYFLANHNLNINYTAFKSPATIENKGTDIISFGYNMNQQRSIMYFGGLRVNPEEQRFRKYYSADGSMEIKYNTESGKVEFVTYIGGDGYTAPIIAKSEGGNSSYFYLHRDHLGSILAISNELGSLIEKRHFDPWGNIVRYYNKYTGAETPFGDALDEAMFLDRGYTGHEHLLSVGLINMNARLYDPVVHRFLQPDTFVQDPTNTQCYNRYGYASNNPLKYSDPSGNVLPALAIAAIIGAGIGAASYTLTALLADVPFNISGLIQAVAISTISSVVTSGIGTACQAITNVANKIVVQAVAHGTFQGVMSGIQGGSFVSGFAAGCLASLASSAFGLDYNGKGKAGLGFAGKFRESGAGMIAFGTISGGAGAALTGGNFWQGAVTGLVVSGLNHHFHKLSQRADLTERLKEAGYNDPQASADYAGLNLDEFAQKVFPDLMVNAKNPHFTKVETIDKKGSLGLTPVGSNDVTGVHTFRGPVLIAKAAFSSYMQLASTMGHELSHVLDCISGNMTAWFKKGGENYRSAMTELKAYQWVGINGGNFNAPMYLYYLNKVGNYYNK